MVKIKITKGFFYSAGFKYRWGPNHTHGVGIAERIFRQNRGKKISVTVSGIEYILDVDEALAFVKAYNAVETYGGVRVGIVSKSLLKPVISHPDASQGRLPYHEKD